MNNFQLWDLARPLIKSWWGIVLTFTCGMIIGAQMALSIKNWLGLSDRLSTNERIVSWLKSCDILCVLCRACTENRDHIFFKCPFTQRSWRIIKRWFCQEGLDDEWGNLITWEVQNWRGKIFRADCCRLGFIAGMYHVWAQRNAVKHQGTVRTKEQI